MFDLSSICEVTQLCYVLRDLTDLIERTYCCLLMGIRPPRAQPLGLPPPPSLLYIRRRGTPWRHTMVPKPCAVPRTPFSTSFIFSESLGEAIIPSPSPSPRRRADGTHLLPRRPAGSRRRGTSSSCTCVELGGAVRSVLDWWSSKDCSTTSTALN